MASGEMVGYFLGYKGRSFVREGRMYARMQPMTAKYGDRAIFFFAVKPVPFEIAGLWAGTARYPIVRFFISVTAENVIRVTLVCVVSHYGLKLLMNPIG